MRPRHYCRGDLSAPVPVSNTCAGFNEAAALLPRRYAGRLDLPQLLVGASMRPRHYCRGDAFGLPTSVQLPAVLQ